MRYLKIIIISIFWMMFFCEAVVVKAEVQLSYTDINGDGSNDKIDAALLLKYLSGATSASKLNLSNADINKDGNMDIIDVGAILADVNIIGYGHIEGVGWQNNIKSGATIGTTGQEKGLEAVRLKLAGGIDGSIEYCAHVQSVGWQNWVSNGNLAGTTGKTLPIEAIRIRLKGAISDTYSVEYRTHITGVGWLGWCADGEISGSVGLAQQAEALQVRLVKKDTSRKYTNVYNVMLPNLAARAHISLNGWLPYVGLTDTIGTVGEGKALEAVQLTVDSKNSNLLGGIRYRTHISNVGWQNWVNDGAIAGTTGQTLPIECVQIELTGDMTKYYDVYYRAHVEEIGWMGWTKNGGMAGTTGGGAQMEALQIKIVYKNSTEISQGDAYRVLESKPTNTLLYPLKGSITRSSSVKTNGYYCDYVASSGTALYAPSNGTVAFKQCYATSYGKLASYGNYIDFTSSDGTYTVRCAHLSGFNGVVLQYTSSLSYPCGASKYTCKSITIKTKTVKQGELIGYTGSTGNASGPHMHLEVKKNGVAVNPTSVFTTW